MALGNGNISLVKGREGIVTVLKHNMALGNGNISLVKGREGIVTVVKQQNVEVRCDFDRASSLICGNKMPTMSRCNRGFYCRYFCLLNMFRAPLCPSSGAQEYYTVVAACGISCCGFQVADLVWSWGLCVRFAECLLAQHEIPQGATIV